MEIRQATPFDIEEIFDIYQQIAQSHFDNAPNAFNPPSQEDKRFLLSKIHDDAWWFAVAESEGKIIGYTMARLDKNETVPFLANTLICRLNTIVVDQNIQTKGVGRALIDACKKWAEQNGAVEVRLEVMSFNEKAVGFYEHIGFEKLSHTMCLSL
ncbi:GNAT family N-acetyltransferase [Grimontia kaedaensis]|uniref:GNAT family N-acetyltransferase n=1 Tax=Grimontia kaedaensis TaxID=2872157 RepID=A0ABY4WZ69_9GAMM|nr:GNAT family N-acetyltransferase [Grimontia kaedaensis]USH04282.1 GNAT family N-acetyltransferase [Grimontia kaedaensis]